MKNNYFKHRVVKDMGDDFVINKDNWLELILYIQQDTLDAVIIQLNKRLVPVNFEGYPIKAVPQVIIIDELKLENL